jgi:excisionase family DNA binding protein
MVEEESSVRYDFVSLAEAAQMLHVRPATLRAQVHRGKLAATKIGRDWLVSRAEVTRYRTESAKRGRAGTET